MTKWSGAAFTIEILRWYRANGRELPWRATHDAYAIWLSEIILQQTRIEQGRPYWERFMQRWPTVADLAAASEDEVLREWQGLGYYSRARHLHAAARQVAAQGGFPTTIAGLRALPGVGDYTAAAVGSMAFGLPAAVVDGNVYRLLSRYYGIRTPIDTTAGKRDFSLLAQRLLPASQGDSTPLRQGEFNQAMMDFGAIQCVPQHPQCSQCPLADSCVAFSEGTVGELPVKQKTLQVRERHLTYVYIRCQGRTAIRRRPAGDIWQGLYEPVLSESGAWTVEQSGYSIGQCRWIARNVKHVLTHRVLFADLLLLETDEQPPLPDGYFWIAEGELDNYAVPRLVERLLQMLFA
jgi:A/G-specific adenine glycosylase